MASLSTQLDRRTFALPALPMPVWTLALVNGVAAFVLGLSTRAPLSRTAPVHLQLALAVLLGASALGLLVFARRIGKRTLLALALGRLAITTVLVGTAVTGGGTFMACAGFVWLAVWAAVFFSRGELILMLGAEAASTVAGVALNQDPVRTASDAAPLLFASALLSVLLLGIIGNLRNQARRDHLTGLLNRHGLEQALDDPLGPQRGSRPTSLVAIDIDGLKEVNDVGGHLAGDQLLVEFATELTRASRSADLPARIGGDEFLIILCDTCATGATSWADRLRAGSQLSWSFGVAERGEDEPLESWLARADQGMYAAKRAGRQVTSQLARAAG